MQYSPSFATNNIVVAGIILALYEAILLIFYFIISTPFIALLQGFIDFDFVPELVTYGSITIDIFHIMFALAFMIPIVWFFVWIWRREAGFSYRRFY